jgi:hypothetical protein
VLASIPSVSPKELVILRILRTGGPLRTSDVAERSNGLLQLNEVSAYVSRLVTKGLAGPPTGSRRSRSYVCYATPLAGRVLDAYEVPPWEVTTRSPQGKVARMKTKTPGCD